MFQHEEKERVNPLNCYKHGTNFFLTGLASNPCNLSYAKMCKILVLEKFRFKFSRFFSFQNLAHGVPTKFSNV